MKIAFNPSTVAALTTPPNNKDITFDLRGQNIFARGVKFYGTDTNTWRDIKVNNVSIGSHTLDLRNGSNTTLTNTNGVVTINSTWRPVVDNLTSNSTTSSLSANQGRVLKALIGGKSDSGHNHDGRYVRYYAVTTLDCNNLAVGLTAARVSATNAAHTNNSVYLYISDIGTPFQIQIPDSNVPYIYKRYYSSGKWSGWFKLNAGYADSAGSVAWSNITGKPSSYTPSAHTHAWNSLTHSSTTENQAILTNGKANGWKLYTLNISGWNNAANNAHSHSNKSVLDSITSGLVSNWNTAYTFVHTITGTDTDKVINKWDEIVNFLAGITEDNKLNTLLNSKLSVYELADKTNVGTIKNNGIYYSTTDASSGTLTNSPFNTGFALINMTSYDGGDDLRRSRLAFNAYGEIKVSDDRGQSNTAETWYKVLTSKNSGISGSTIKLNGTSITVYSSGTADGRYVKKSGDTMTGVLTIDTTNFGTLTIKRNDDANGASIQFRGKSSVYGYIGLNNSTKDKQFLRWNSDTSKFYTILDTSSTYTSSGKGVINGTTITQVDNATNATNSTNARKLVNWYSARPTSLNAQFGDGSLRIFHATSSTTEGKPAEDSHILHLAWDNTGGWDAQLAVHIRSGKVSTRAQSSGTWQPWKTLAFTTDIPSSLKNPHSFNVFGVTYDGSAAKTVTTSTFISQVNEAASTITDGTMLITSYASNSGFADTNAVNIPYKRKAVHLWEYIKAKTDSLYATKNHNHDGRYVRTFGTSNDNIDSDWGESFKTFDPIPSGTPPEQSANISLLSIGNNFNRRKQLAFIYNNDNIYYRRHVNNSFSNWRRLAFANEIPTSLKNPHALTISLNGTSQGPYDGSAAKNINITPGSIGAATRDHNHDDRYLKLSGGTMTGTINRRSGGSTISGRDHAIIRQNHAPGGSSWNPIACVDTETGTWTLGHLSFGDSDTSFHFCFSTNVDYNAGNNNGNYVTLRNIAGTIALTSEIPNKNSWNYDDRYLKLTGGTMLLGEGLKFHANDNYFGTNADARIISLLDYNGKICDGGLIIDERATLNGKEYVTELLRIRDSEFKWRGADILHSGNYSGILDSRYYTESEVNSLLSNKLNTSNFNWTNLPGKIVAGNEFNIVNAGFKEDLWFNYLPINDRSKSATIRAYCFGNGNKGYTAVRASGFIKNGGNASQLLRADGGVTAFNWSGQAGQPTWLWGGNSQHSYYVYNPSNFRVAYAASAGNADTLDGEHANSFVRAGAIDTDKTDLNALDTYSFIKSVNSKVADHSPKRNTGWYNVIQLVHRNGAGDGASYIGQIALGMTTNTDDMFFRGKRTDSWKTVIHSGNISSQTVASATKLQTARKIWGQSFDGTADVSGTLSNAGHINFLANNTYDVGSNTSAIRYIYTYWIGAKSGQKLELGANNSVYGKGLCLDTNLNVGIGTNTPSYKLDVKGDIYSSGYARASSGFIKDSSSNAYVLLGGGSHKLESALNVAHANISSSANKLTTVRNIALGTDLRGSANFDGSSNIIINANINACTIGVGSTNGLPFKRIAHFETGSSWNDNALLLYISQGYINGSNGICRVEFRTDNISSSNSNPSASSLVRWLVRNGYNLDSLYVGYYVTTGKAYIDIYLKTTGGYQGTVIRVLQDSRGGINSNVQLIDSYYYSDTNHKEAYNSVEAASTALYNRAYTRIVSGSDVGTVSHANSASNADTTDGVHIKWAGSLTSTSHLVAWEKDGSALRDINPANVSVGYASSAGNASTLGGTSLSGLFTAFGNNAHNITATIGGVTKSFLVNWAADSDKLDGKHASDFAAASHTHKWADITDRITKLSQLTNDKGFVTGSVSGKTITINGTSTTWSNTWRPISDDYELGESGTSLSTLGSLTMYNDLLGSIPNPTSYYWANIKVSSSSSTTTSPTVHTLNATRVCAGHNPGIDNSISCSNWFRSSGNTGWYSTSYGGGWYMSDKDWIRSWGSKALYINNSIRSTNYQVMYGSTSVSAAKLESANTLVYGTDTSSQSINTYLRGTNVIMQVKKGTSINYNALQLTANYIYCNNYCAMKYGAAVNGGNFTVFTDSYLAQLIGSKVGIGTKNPQYTLDVGDTMRAGGYIHSGHNSNDAMLLAGGGWKKLSTLVEYPSDENYIYRKTTTEYDLRFVKLVNFNNLIYVDGWISADANGKSFTLGAKFKPYLYRDDHSMPTIVQMGWDDVVTIDGDGNVGFHIEGGRKKRIGFFYTGRA